MQDLSVKASEALKACFVTIGKNKGTLKKNAPPSDTLAYAAWQGAMMSVNPFKVSIFGSIMMTEEQREIMQLVTQAFDMTKGAKALDRDRCALERLGVW